MGLYFLIVHFYLNSTSKVDLDILVGNGLDKRRTTTLLTLIALQETKTKMEY